MRRENLLDDLVLGPRFGRTLRAFLHEAGVIELEHDFDE
jgi:hypothetical protein